MAAQALLLAVFCFIGAEAFSQQQAQPRPLPHGQQQLGANAAGSPAAFGQSQIPQNVPAIQSLDHCYVCTDCPRVESDTPVKVCMMSTDPNRAQRCITYVEKYKHLKKPWVIRGCASERGTCEDIRRAHEQHSDTVDLLNCVECVGDSCNTNGVGRTSAQLFMALLTLVITGAFAKKVF